MKHAYAALLIATCMLWPACLLQAQTKPTFFQEINSKRTWYDGAGIHGSAMIVWNGHLYFNGQDSAHHLQLWHYDGSSAPASILSMPGSGGGALTEKSFAIYKGKLFYAGGDFNTTGMELAAYDGVHPPAVVADLSPGKSSSVPGYFAILNGYLFFSADSSAYGIELYRYDGLSRPRRISIGIDTIIGGGGSSPRELVPFDNSLYFTAYPPSVAERHLYECDQNGNYAIAKGTGGLSRFYGLTALEHAMYFVAYTSAHGFELYSYDGDTALRLTDVGSGPVNGLPADSTNVAFVSGNAFRPTLYNGALYFPGSTTGVNYQLYKYDLAAQSTSLAATLHPSGVSRANGLPMTPNSFHVYDGSLFFSAYTPAEGYELWKWDGTSCALFADIQPGPKGSLAWYDDSISVAYRTRFSGPGFTEFMGQLYFIAVDSLHGRELWRMGTQTNGITQAKWQGAVKLYPNPATNRATLELRLPSAQRLSLSVTDASGREVYHLANREYTSGTSSVAIPLQGLAPGQYFYRLLGGGECLAAGALLRQ